uniref:Uncharacterized protein n=1 Tax=Anopheles arabiensis TaxID=7173 RepID=A0A8W7MT51_ANOAR
MNMGKQFSTPGGRANRPTAQIANITCFAAATAAAVLHMLQIKFHPGALYMFELWIRDTNPGDGGVGFPIP